MTPDELASNIAGYMATRNTPWPDEAAMREAVTETVRLLCGEAWSDTLRVIIGAGLIEVCDGDCSEHYDGRHFSVLDRL